MDILINLIIVITSQKMCTSKHHAECLQCIKFCQLCLNKAVKTFFSKPGNKIDHCRLLLISHLRKKKMSSSVVVQMLPLNFDYINL